MIINHTHKFVFIHIPKTAGTSVTNCLSRLTRYCDQEIGATYLGEAVQVEFWSRFGLRKHSCADEALRVMGADTFNSYYRFAFVRNPYSRLVSAYYFLKAWGDMPIEYRPALDACATVDEFLESEMWTSADPGRGPDAIFRPQAEWVLSWEEERVLLVDFVGKIESLTGDMRHILSVIGAGSVSNLVRDNPTPAYETLAHWSPSVVRRVQEEYRQDFDLFGYDDTPTKRKYT